MRFSIMNWLNLFVGVCLCILFPCYECDDGIDGDSADKLQQRECECTCEPDNYPDGDECEDTKWCTKTCRLIYRLICFDKFKCSRDLRCDLYNDCFDNCELQMMGMRGRKTRGKSKLSQGKKLGNKNVGTKMQSSPKVSKLCLFCGRGNGGASNNNNNNNNNGWGGNNNNNNNNNNGGGGGRACFMFFCG